MLWRLALISLAGCGRIGFEVTSQPSDAPADVLSGHDEDGDGVPDSIDVCPHVADSQSDGDGDEVGDACDPNVVAGGDRIALFATMRVGDQPLLVFADPMATWTQGDDALRLDGDLAGDFYAGASLPMNAGTVRVELGVDIITIGSAGTQHQFAITTSTLVPNYFGELNESSGLPGGAYITEFDGAVYNNRVVQAIAGGIHPGAIRLSLDQRVATSTMFEATWPGEPYVVMIADNLYQGSDLLQININNLQLEIRYLVMITSP
jgi:hypothetical protein